MDGCQCEPMCVACWSAQYAAQGKRRLAAITAVTAVVVVGFVLLVAALS